MINSPFPDAPRLDAVPLAIVVDLIRSGRASTRSQLVEVTGLGRRVIVQHVERALALGLVEEAGPLPSGGGRRPQGLRFKKDAGYILVAHVGNSELQVGVLDLDASVIRLSHEDWDPNVGPVGTMEKIGAVITDLGTEAKSPWAIVVGVPAPVALDGTVGATELTGWGGFNPRDWLRKNVDAPVWVENDANLMALGEWANLPEVERNDLIFVKLSTELGAGLIVGDRLVRGARGAAGDFAHSPVASGADEPCDCGKSACLASVSSGRAVLARVNRMVRDNPDWADLAKDDGAALSFTDLGAAARAGDARVIALIEDSFAPLGAAIAGLINTLNPAIVVIGGGVANTGGARIDRLRDLILSAVTPVARDGLEIRTATSAPLEGIHGGAELALRELLSTESLARWILDGDPIRRTIRTQQTAS